MDKRTSGASIPTEAPNTGIERSEAPGTETPLHFPEEEVPTSATARGRAEVESATARRSAHSEAAVKQELADASLASSREQDLSPSPALLERYEILSLLGRGGMGVVYRARVRASGEVVAVKVLLESRASAAERFIREAAVLSGLDHPGIVRYGAHGVTEAGEPYLAMEWLDGRISLAALGAAS